MGSVLNVKRQRMSKLVFLIFFFLGVAVLFTFRLIMQGLSAAKEYVDNDDRFIASSRIKTKYNHNKNKSTLVEFITSTTLKQFSIANLHPSDISQDKFVLSYLIGFIEGVTDRSDPILSSDDKMWVFCECINGIFESDGVDIIGNYLAMDYSEHQEFMKNDGFKSAVRDINGYFDKSVADRTPPRRLISYLLKEKNRHQNSVTPPRQVSKYKSFNDWFEVFKNSCDETRAGISPFLEFMDVSNLREAYAAGEDPVILGSQFAEEFDPTNIGNPPL